LSHAIHNALENFGADPAKQHLDLRSSFKKKKKKSMMTTSLKRLAELWLLHRPATHGRKSHALLFFTTPCFAERLNISCQLRDKHVLPLFWPPLLF